MPDGEVPRVEQVPLLVIDIVPVTMGAGLTPGEAISVEPSGIPTGPTVEPVVMPSGEVAPMVGVGLATPPTCAVAGLQMTSAGRTAAINEYFTCTLRFATSRLVRSYRALVNPQRRRTRLRDCMDCFRANAPDCFLCAAAANSVSLCWNVDGSLDLFN
jgi:hypothetical protein